MYLKRANQKPENLKRALDITKRKLKGGRPISNFRGALLGSFVLNLF
jgi:hypothetical protein